MKTYSEMVFELGEQLIRLKLTSDNPTTNKRIKFENSIFSLVYDEDLKRSLYFKGSHTINFRGQISDLMSRELVNKIISECYNSLF